jgi:hypothetical protein
LSIAVSCSNDCARNHHLDSVILSIGDYPRS